MAKKTSTIPPSTHSTFRPLPGARAYVPIEEVPAEYRDSVAPSSVSTDDYVEPRSTRGSRYIP